MTNRINEFKPFILNKLEKELSPLLTYHNIEHTLNVYNAVKLICMGEKINPKQTELLLTAALLHDSGFIIQRKGHEEISCDIARQYLPDFSYTKEEINFICSVIMATEVKHQPTNIYEEIIKDADLDYLGTIDYDRVSDSLFIELKNYSLVSGNRNEWITLQSNFLKAHVYFTKTSIELRNSIKQKVLKHLLNE